MPYPSPRAADSIRVASFNIRKCKGLDGRRDPHRIARVLSGIGADIIALQEADKRLGSRPSALPREVIENETDLIPLPVAKTTISLGWHGNALLVAPDWQLQDLHRVTLPGLEPRGAIIADLAHSKSSLRVVTTHLGLRRRDRQRQLTTIMAHLAALPPRPSVLMGDLNEWSRAAGFAPLDPFFTIQYPGRSFPARYPVAALDRVATGPGLSLSSMGVIRTGEAGRASDHLPIWADLYH